MPCLFSKSTCDTPCAQLPGWCCQDVSTFILWVSMAFIPEAFPVPLWAPAVLALAQALVLQMLPLNTACAAPSTCAPADGKMETQNFFFFFLSRSGQPLESPRRVGFCLEPIWHTPQWYSGASVLLEGQETEMLAMFWAAKGLWAMVVYVASGPELQGHVSWPEVTLLFGIHICPISTGILTCLPRSPWVKNPCHTWDT